MNNTYLNKKCHNKYKKNLICKTHIIRFGDFGIKSFGYGLFTESRLELLNRFVNKQLKVLSKNSNSIKFWNLIKMTSNSTALTPESRMGKGKGLIKSKFSYIKPGMMLFEFTGLDNYQAVLIHKHLKLKFSFPTKLVKLNNC